MTDLVVSRVGVLAEKRDAGHQHSGRAVTALQTVLLVEAVLKWMQFAVLFESFDSHDAAPVSLHGECSARLDRAAVHHDRARAAVARVATDVRSGQTQRLTQEMDQQHARFDFSGTFDSVDVYFDRNFVHRLSVSFRAFERSLQCASCQNANQIAFVIG